MSRAEPSKPSGAEPSRTRRQAHAELSRTEPNTPPSARRVQRRLHRQRALQERYCDRMFWTPSMAVAWLRLFTALSSLSLSLSLSLFNNFKSVLGPRRPDSLLTHDRPPSDWSANFRAQQLRLGLPSPLQHHVQHPCRDIELDTNARTSHHRHHISAITAGGARSCKPPAPS